MGEPAPSPTAGLASLPSLVVGVAQGRRPHTGWRLRYDKLAFDLR